MSAMRRLLLIALIASACRPEPVLDPSRHHRRSGSPEVQRDVSQSPAPSGVVTARDGTPFDIATLWDRRRVVLVFYMGHWCPACQKQLSEYNARAKDFDAQDATIVAVSTDTPDDASALRDKLGLSFELYVDPQLQMITKWGVQDSETNIARPSTFVIETGGNVSYRRVGDKNSDRPSADELISFLNKG
jgi:peroxiredoxin